MEIEMGKENKQDEVLANCRSYIILGEDAERHRDSRKATVYTNPFFRMPKSLLPYFAGEIYNLVKEKGFDVGEPVAYITNISKTTDSEEIERFLSVDWITKGIDDKGFDNKGRISFEVDYLSEPFSKEDLDYAGLKKQLKRDCHDFDLYKLMEKAKWKTFLRFGLERHLCDSIMPKKEKVPITLIESAYSDYHFNSDGEFRKANSKASFTFDAEELINRFKGCGLTASTALVRGPRAWKKEEFGSETEDYSEIVERYFPNINIQEPEVAKFNLERAINKLLPSLIEAEQEFVEN